MSRATELADEADTLVRLHKSSGLGMDPDAAAGLLERKALELRRLERVNAELVEALQAVHDRLSACAGLSMYPEEVYDSFYREIVEAALTSATKETK